MVKFFIFIIFLVSLAGGEAFAEEFRQLYRGTRAQGMGNAYVGLADDEQAVFLNPAGLAGNTQYKFHYLLADIAVADDIVQSAKSVSTFSNLSPSTMNKVMGKNIYASAQYTPMLLMGPIAFAGIISAETLILAQNRTLPDITLGFQNTNGVQFSSGFVLGNKRNRYRQLRLGLGVKMLWQRGGYKKLPVTKALSLSKSELQNMLGEYSAIVGSDIGLQYVMNFNKRLTYSLGLVQNDLSFKTSKGVTSVTEGMGTFGMALKYNPGAVSYALTFDYRNIFESADWRKKVHLGGELSLPLLSFYAGINQFYGTFGVGFNLWIFKVNAVSYAEELGVASMQDGQRRYVLSLDLNLPL